MDNELFISDPSFKYPILISTIPVDPDTYSFASGSIPANSQTTIVWVTTASRPQLSLWNFHFTIRFGTDDDAHKWPNGGSLTGNQISTEVSMFTDALDSYDPVNNRVNKIVIKNTSADTFNYYCYFKSYTFATSVGIQA